VKAVDELLIDDSAWVKCRVKYRTYRRRRRPVVCRRTVQV
jgi:hypothetical protein